MLINFSIPYNPVFYSYSVITPTKALLYIDSGKLSDGVRSHLGDAVTLRPYDSIFDEIRELRKPSPEDPADEKSVPSSTEKKFLVSTKSSWALSQALGGLDKTEEIRSPVLDAKAIKNQVEVEGMKACHMRDGAALTEFFAWLEEELCVKGTKIDEVQAADKLEQIRS